MVHTKDHQPKFLAFTSLAIYPASFSVKHANVPINNKDISSKNWNEML